MPPGRMHLICCFICNNCTGSLVAGRSMAMMIDGFLRPTGGTKPGRSGPCAQTSLAMKWQMRRYLPENGMCRWPTAVGKPLLHNDGSIKTGAPHLNIKLGRKHSYFKDRTGVIDQRRTPLGIPGRPRIARRRMRGITPFSISGKSFLAQVIRRYFRYRHDKKSTAQRNSSCCCRHAWLHNYQRAGHCQLRTAERGRG